MLFHKQNHYNVRYKDLHVKVKYIIDIMSNCFLQSYLRFVFSKKSESQTFSPTVLFCDIVGALYDYDQLIPLISLEVGF